MHVRARVYEAYGIRMQPVKGMLWLARDPRRRFAHVLMVAALLDLERSTSLLDLPQ